MFCRCQPDSARTINLWYSILTLYLLDRIDTHQKLTDCFLWYFSNLTPFPSLNNLLKCDFPLLPSCVQCLPCLMCTTPTCVQVYWYSLNCLINRLNIYIKRHSIYILFSFCFIYVSRHKLRLSLYESKHSTNILYRLIYVR